MLRWICVLTLALTAACDGQPNRRELEGKIELLKAENDKLRQTTGQADTASARYDACLADADSAYRNQWNANCAMERRDALRQRANCKANGGSDEICISTEVPAAANCALPTELADRINGNLKDDQRLCLGRLKVEY